MSGLPLVLLLGETDKCHTTFPVLKPQTTPSIATLNYFKNKFILKLQWDGTIDLWKVNIEADRYSEEQDDGSVFLGETKRGPTPLRRSKRLARRKYRRTDTTAS